MLVMGVLLKNTACIHFRTCPKNAFCKIYVTLCGRFCLNKTRVMHCVNETKTKPTTKCGIQYLFLFSPCFAVGKRCHLLSRLEQINKM